MRKSEQILVTVLAGILMSGLMSLVVTIKNLGIPDDFLGRWLSAWLVAYIIGQPILFAVLPFSRFLVQKIMDRGQK